MVQLVYRFTCFDDAAFFTINSKLFMRKSQNAKTRLNVREAQGFSKEKNEAKRSVSQLAAVGFLPPIPLHGFPAILCRQWPHLLLERNDADVQDTGLDVCHDAP
jgi:hypothetical protein